MSLKHLSKILNKSTSIEDNVTTRLTSYSSEFIEDKLTPLLPTETDKLYKRDKILAGSSISVIKDTDNNLVIQLTHNSNPPKVRQLPAGTYKKPYNQVINITGEGAPYTLTIIDTLPNGLVYDENSLTLSGIPEFTGEILLHTRIVDKNNIEYKYDLILFVQEHYATISIPDYITNYHNNVAWYGGVTTVNFTKPVTYMAIGLPPGFEISSTTGQITVTDSDVIQIGSYDIRVICTEDDNDITELSSTLTVRASTISITNNNLAIDVIVNQEINYQVTVSSIDTPITYALENAVAGIKISNQGLITGNLTSVTTSTFNVIATNRYGISDTKTISLTSLTPLAVTINKISPAMASRPYRFEFSHITGGKGPYTITNLSGKLKNITSETSPSIDNIVFYSPKVEGLFQADIFFSIKIVDTLGNELITTLELNIERYISSKNDVTEISLAPHTVGVAYTNTLEDTLQSNNDTSTSIPSLLYFNYRLTGVPPGLTFYPNAFTISGTPTVPGTYDMTLEVYHDSWSYQEEHGNTGIKLYNVRLHLNPALSVILNSPCPPGYVNIDYNYTLDLTISGGTLANGVKGIQWTVTNPPYWLTYIVTDEDVPRYILSGIPKTLNQSVLMYLTAKDDVGSFVDLKITFNIGGYSELHIKSDRERFSAIIGTPYTEGTYSARYSTTYNNIGQAASGWDYPDTIQYRPLTVDKVFYPNRGIWCHQNRTGWIMHKYASPQTLRTLTLRQTANGVGASAISYYYLVSDSDETGTLIETHTYTLFDDYENMVPYVCGLNCNILCYGIRIVTSAYGGSNYSVIISPVTSYCE
jgi:hypothetical protein